MVAGSTIKNRASENVTQESKHPLAILTRFGIVDENDVSRPGLLFFSPVHKLYVCKDWQRTPRKHDRTEINQSIVFNIKQLCRHTRTRTHTEMWKIKYPHVA